MIIKNKDKYLHLLVGAVVAAAASLVHPFIGVILVLAMAYAKEQRDKLDPMHHTYDGWDAYATSVGLVLGQAFIYGLVYFKFWSFILVF